MGVLTGRVAILSVARGTVGIMQQPAVIRSFKNEALWSLDPLDQVIPKLVEAKTAHDARARDASAPQSAEPGRSGS